MAVFIVVLDDSRHCLNRHFMEVEFVLSIFSMAKSLAKDVETLEPPMEGLLPILCSSHKLSKFFRMFSFCHNDFIRLTNIATVSNAFLTFPQLKI